MASCDSRYCIFFFWVPFFLCCINKEKKGQKKVRIKRKHFDSNRFRKIQHLLQTRPKIHLLSDCPRVQGRLQVYDYIHYLENATEPLSHYVHLPFCRSACYFCGCNVVFTSKEGKLSQYIEYLKKR